MRVLSAADIRHVERAGRKARAPPPGETRSTAAEGPERSGRGGEFKSRLLCARVSGVPAARQVESRLHRPPEPPARRVSPPPRVGEKAVWDHGGRLPLHPQPGLGGTG